MKKTRKRLEKNKVFFEVFSYIFLGIASLIVAYFSYQTSQGQLEILRLEHLPIITTDRDFKEETELVMFNNVGYHLFEPKVFYTSAFVLKGLTIKGSLKKNNTFIKVNDYFVHSYETNNSTGIISTVYSSNYRLSQTQRIMKECSSSIRNDSEIDYDYGVFEHYFMITFKDEQKNKHSKFYKVDPFVKLEISKETYEAYVDSISKNENSDLHYLKHITGEKLMAHINDINQ